MRTMNVALALGVFLLAGCTSPGDRQTGGETHWLMACTGSADCGGLSCIVGVCTTACSTDDDCTQLDARCTNVAGLARFCTPICDSDSFCEDLVPGWSCGDEACVPGPVMDTDAASLPSPDTSETDAGPGPATDGGASTDGTSPVSGDTSSPDPEPEPESPDGTGPADAGGPTDAAQGDVAIAPDPATCAMCAAPYPACVLIGDLTYCVQCAQDSDCPEGKCVLEQYACTKSGGGDLPCAIYGCPAVDGKELSCDPETNVCYDVHGRCDNITSFCAQGSTCVEMQGGGGGAGASSWGMCTCGEATEPPADPTDPACEAGGGACLPGQKCVPSTELVPLQFGACKLVCVQQSE